jgi:hypothetical protein
VVTGPNSFRIPLTHPSLLYLVLTVPMALRIAITHTVTLVPLHQLALIRKSRVPIKIAPAFSTMLMSHDLLHLVLPIQKSTGISSILLPRLGLSTYLNYTLPPGQPFLRKRQ